MTFLDDLIGKKCRGFVVKLAKFSPNSNEVIITTIDNERFYIPHQEALELLKSNKSNETSEKGE